MTNSLQAHGLQHSRLPCPSLSRWVCSDSCPVSWWCHPTISSSVAPSPPAFNLSQYQGLCLHVMCLLFNTLFRFVIAFLPRSKRLLIVWLRLPSTEILQLKKIKSVPVITFFPSISPEVMGPDVMILVFLIWVLGPVFHSPLSPSSRSPLVPGHSAIKVVSLRLLIFLPEILIPNYESLSPTFCMMYSVWKLNKQGYSFDVLLSQFGTSLLIPVQF